jgi:hypothetical protein
MPLCVGSGVVTPLPGVVGVPLVVVVEDETVVEDVVVEDIPVVIVMLEDLVVVVVVVVVDVGSPVTLPSTQYSLLVSRLGQVIPGFSWVSSSTESPQLLARLWQVSPLLTDVE